MTIRAQQTSITEQKKYRPQLNVPPKNQPFLYTTGKIFSFFCLESSRRSSILRKKEKPKRNVLYIGNTQNTYSIMAYIKTRLYERKLSTKSYSSMEQAVVIVQLPFHNVLGMSFASVCCMGWVGWE